MRVNRSTILRAAICVLAAAVILVALAPYIVVEPPMRLSLPGSAALRPPRVEVVTTDIEFGNYRFTPAPGTQVNWVGNTGIDTNAIMIDGGLRWMVKADEGRLPRDAQILHVILGLTETATKPYTTTETPQSFGELQLVKVTTQDEYFEIADTKDAYGLPLRMVCHLGERERRALISFGTLEGMRDGDCSVWFYPAVGVRALIQPFPVRHMPDAQTLLPSFYWTISQSLVRTH